MQRAGEVNERLTRYVELIVASSEQMTELLEEVGLAARIAGGRYDPVLADVDTLELARRALPTAKGAGTVVTTDVATVERALASLAEAARKHGLVEEVRLEVDGAAFTLEPVPAQAGPVVLGEELKDLGAAVAVRAIAALGGTVGLSGERLLIRLVG